MTWLLGARAFLGRLPWQVWAAIGLALVLWLGVRWHNGQIHDAEKRGEARAYAAVEKKARELEAKANATADKIRSKTDEQARAIAADADTLRVSGPGKARTCPIPAAPGRREEAGGKPDAAVDRLPGEGGVELAAVPWDELVGRAETCDLNLNEVAAWREWYGALAK